jgi:N-acetylglutamate synthase-like GNAT family acetyltransferase
LELDAGYLSRLLADFEKRGLIARKPSPDDARQSLVCLTSRGHQAFHPLEVGVNKETAAMLHELQESDRGRLLDAMQIIEGLLSEKASAKPALVLRTHRPGDIGWVIHRHGVLYAQEYGWDERFEAKVAHIAAKFIDNFDPQFERFWIAELNGVNVGSICLVKKSARVGQLRLLLVEPAARGYGVGRRLVNECIRFAGEVGYRKVTLWTQSDLHAARHIYSETGFRLVKQERQKSFGRELVFETWDLKL